MFGPVPAILALLSSALWGSGDYLGGTLTKRLRPLVVVGWSQVCGLIFMAVLALSTDAWRAPIGYIGWSALAALCGLVGLVAFYKALADGAMGIVAPLASLGSLVPIVVGLLSGDHPSSWQLGGIAAALVGIVLASGPEMSGQASRRNVGLALFAAAVFGVVLLAVAQGSRTSPIMAMVAMRGFQVLLAGAAALRKRELGGIGRRDFRWLAPIGFLDVMANVTYGYAAQRGLLSLVSALGGLYPVMTLALAAGIDRERLRRIQYFGVAATMAGVLLISAGGAVA